MTSRPLVPRRWVLATAGAAAMLGEGLATACTTCPPGVLRAVSAGQVLLAVAAGIGAWHAARAAPAARAPWLLLSGAAGSVALGQVVFALAGRASAALTALAEASFVLAVLLGAAALLALRIPAPATARAREREGLGPGRLVLDAAVVGGCLVALGWADTATSGALAGLLPAGAAAVAILVGDVTIGTLAVMAASYARRGAGLAMAVLSAGVLAVIVSDGAPYLTALLTVPSPEVTNAGWLVAGILLTLAAAGPRPGHLGWGASETSVASVVLPYVPLVLAAAILARDPTLLLRDLTALRIHLGVVALVVARQMLTLGHNRSLGQRLERKVAELHRSETLYRSLVSQAAGVILLVRRDGRIRYASPTLAAVLGLEPDTVLGRPLEDLVDPRDRAGLAEAVADWARRPGAGGDVSLRWLTAGGDVIVGETSGTNLLDDPGVRALVVNLRDRSERAAFERELRHQALHDALTGLANRQLLRERLELAERRRASAGAPYAVMFVDLDDFKHVNDSLGHACGDDILRQTGDRLRAALKDGDTVARLSGDEFAILAEGLTGQPAAVEAAARVADAFREPFRVAGRAVVVGASVGLALPGCDHRTPDDLLRNADLAMYEAKAGGKGRVACYRPELHASAVRRGELEVDLRGAAGRGELTVHYQPVVMLSTGRIVGLEALVRWQHPRLGHLPPAEFISVAERTGLIGEVGEFVLRTACADGQRWRQLPGYGDLRVGVNLSARQLAEPALVATVMGALRDSGLESSGLILEITESILVSATGEGGDRLKQLRAAGVRLALDDFGTGYSSLAYLRDFDVQVMKLDRSFISRLADDPPAAHLVRAILHLAASLSLDVVAEGVERPKDLAALQDMGCGFVQGFLLARPAPAPGIAGLLAGWDATRWTPARSGSG